MPYNSPCRMEMKRLGTNLNICLATESKIIKKPVRKSLMWSFMLA